MALDDLYSKDIAPLKNTYGLTQEESAFIGGMKDREVLPQIDNVLKLQGAIQRQKMNELAYNRSKFEFKKAKEKSQREAEYIGKADNLFQEFDRIIKSSEDSFDGLKKMSDWAMQNAKQLSEHDVTKSVYNAAISRLKSSQAGKEYEFKQADRLDRNTGQAFNIAQYGNIEAVESMINADGEVTPNEQAAMEFAMQRNKEKDDGVKSATSKAQFDAAMKTFTREEKEYKFEAAKLDAQIEKVESILDSLEPQEKVERDLEDYGQKRLEQLTKKETRTSRCNTFGVKQT